MENKGYPEVNLDSWVKVGEGGNGVIYEHPEKPDLPSDYVQVACGKEHEITHHLLQ